MSRAKTFSYLLLRCVEFGFGFGTCIVRVLVDGESCGINSHMGERIVRFQLPMDSLNVTPGASSPIKLNRDRASEWADIMSFDQTNTAKGFSGWFKVILRIKHDLIVQPD